MADFPTIFALIDLLAARHIRRFVVSPGSRSAPLTLAAARHPDMEVRVVADERSAAFAALGMAQQSAHPVGLICTSGSAVYNYAPAVAEAFLSGIPLIILTADRPVEWVFQQDGQTLQQNGLFEPHVKRSYTLPADYVHPDSRWAAERMMNEAITLCQLQPPGPVHLNVPLREPLYPTDDKPVVFEKMRRIETLNAMPTLPPDVWHRLLDEWENASRRVVLLGQLPYSPPLRELLQKLVDEWNVVVIGEITGNIGYGSGFITQTDGFIGSLTPSQADALRPDLLITLGNSWLSRNLKTFFRHYPAQQHWHISPVVDQLTDSLQHLTHQIQAEPFDFLEKLFADVDYAHFVSGDEPPENEAYLKHWQNFNDSTHRSIQQLLKDATHPLTDWRAVNGILDTLPSDSILHLANSMPVRYANLCQIAQYKAIRVWSNRGVSGIDGCLSTAIGAALSTDKIVTLLIGDIAFFYDRNGLWQQNLPSNLRIILLNNDAGHIFRLLDGPARQPELETYFETPHGYTAERTAQEAHLSYYYAETAHSLQTTLTHFFDDNPTAKLVEIKTNKLENQTLFTSFKTKQVELIRTI